MSRFPLVLALSFATLVACGEPVPSGGSFTPPQRRAPAPVVADAEAPVEEYYYNPAGKRDPFQGVLTHKDRANDEISKDAVPLQRWDVDKYVLHGIIWNTSSPRALLIDPEGTGHVVRVGTYVGRNWGKVTSIEESGLVVTEEYQNIDGELIVNPVSVRFPSEAKK
jgi:type IV pilus assembly protein PilP